MEVLYVHGVEVFLMLLSFNNCSISALIAPVPRRNAIIIGENANFSSQLRTEFLCLSQFLNSGLQSIDVNMFKMFMLLYADDIVFFANSPDELQRSLDLLSNYCYIWKLTVNISKTKVMVFRNGGILPRDLAFYYNGEPLEISSNI